MLCIISNHECDFNWCVDDINSMSYKVEENVSQQLHKWESNVINANDWIAYFIGYICVLIMCIGAYLHLEISHMTTSDNLERLTLRGYLSCKNDSLVSFLLCVAMSCGLIDSSCDDCLLDSEWVSCWTSGARWGEWGGNKELMMIALRPMIAWACSVVGNGLVMCLASCNNLCILFLSSSVFSLSLYICGSCHLHTKTKKLTSFVRAGAYHAVRHNTRMNCVVLILRIVLVYH
jgi:hypothetical protein